MSVCSKRILAWESISYPYKSWGSGIVWKVKMIRIPVAAGGAEGILHSRPFINEPGRQPSYHGHTAPGYQEVTSVGHIIGNVWDFLNHPQRNVVENKILPCSQDQVRTHFFWVTLSKGDGRSPETTGFPRVLKLKDKLQFSEAKEWIATVKRVKKEQTPGHRRSHHSPPGRHQKAPCGFLAKRPSVLPWHCGQHGPVLALPNPLKAHIGPSFMPQAGMSSSGMFVPAALPSSWRIHYGTALTYQSETSVRATETSTHTAAFPSKDYCLILLSYYCPVHLDRATCCIKPFGSTVGHTDNGNSVREQVKGCCNQLVSEKITCWCMPHVSLLLCEHD